MRKIYSSSEQFYTKNMKQKTFPYTKVLDSQAVKHLEIEYNIKKNSVGQTFS